MTTEGGSPRKSKYIQTENVFDLNYNMQMGQCLRKTEAEEEEEGTKRAEFMSWIAK